LHAAGVTLRAALGIFRGIGFAVWLGVIALAINAYVPVHLAYDVAAAVDAAAGDDHHATHAAHRHDDDGAPDDHPSHPASHRDCQVCTTVCAGGSMALPVVVEAPPPVALARWIGPTLAQAERPTGCPASYVSRAPPSIV
jgi:hypothetical protein